MTLVDQVRSIIDELGDAIFWGETQVQDALDDALLQMWTSARHVQIEDTVVVTTATNLFAWPSTIMIPQRIIYDANQNSPNDIHDFQEYFPTTFTKLEQWDFNWQNNRTGPPKFFVLWDYEHLLAVPTPDASYTLTIHGVQWIPQIDNVTVDLVEHPMFKLAVAHFAAATLLLATRPDLYSALMAESDEYLNRFKVQLRNRQPSNILRLRPSVWSERATSGVVRIGNRLS